jgi:two-component system, OmpR family, response regulator QseB
MIGKSVREGLRQDGYSVDLVQDGVAAAMALDNEVYDLLLLDLGLPRKSGMDVLAELRRRKNPIPVLILTARDSVADRIAGLDAGADDYLVKPFSLDELAARIRALLRRKSGHPEPVIEHGRLTINPASREVTLDGLSVALSAREFSLLNTLMQQAGSPLSRAQLEESLYGWDEEIESNAVEVYIHALRRKLGGEMIRNVRGVGYFIPKAP